MLKTNSLSHNSDSQLPLHAAAAALHEWPDGTRFLKRAYINRFVFQHYLSLEKRSWMMVSSKYTLGSFSKLESKRSCMYSCKLFIWNILSSSSNIYFNSSRGLHQYIRIPYVYHSLAGS
jgi:hypothetical protein